MRVERGAPLLIRRLGRATTVVELIRAANAVSDPVRVADVVVARAASWLPAPCWAVVGSRVGGSPVVLAARGLGPREATAVRAFGSWTLRRSRVASAADLSVDARVPHGPAVAAVALPLACRTRTVAALVGLDNGVASTAPRLPRALRRALRLVLEPAAIAFDNARRIEQAERRAVTDDLTGLYNVRALTVALRREAALATRTGRPLSALVIDLDGFKQINDRYGHLRGSRVLVEVSALLRDGTRETDVVARFGGDEFAVLLPDTAGEGAIMVGDRLRARIARHVFLRRVGCCVRVTASVGVATTSGPAASAAGLLELADRALYHVKAGGGNRTGTRAGGYSAMEQTT
jgi:diguanylate cyclase (GGDEF)-like protein